MTRKIIFTTLTVGLSVISCLFLGYKTFFGVLLLLLAYQLAEFIE